MKRIVLLMTLAVMMMSTAGCNSCGRSRWSCWNWFNRGDCCDQGCGSGGGPWMGAAMGSGSTTCTNCSGHVSTSDGWVPAGSSSNYSYGPEEIPNPSSIGPQGIGPPG